MATMVIVDTELCTGCKLCDIGVCPVNALSIVDFKCVISDDCIGCGSCIPECPINALGYNPEA